MEIVPGDVDIISFEIAAEALALTQKEYYNESSPAILFPDTNMPDTTGWEFMKHYENSTRK